MFIKDILSYCYNKLQHKGGFRVGDIVYSYIDNSLHGLSVSEWKGKVVSLTSMFDDCITVEWYAENELKNGNEIIDWFSNSVAFEHDESPESLSKIKKLRW